VTNADPTPSQDGGGDATDATDNDRHAPDDPETVDVDATNADAVAVSAPPPPATSDGGGGPVGAPPPATTRVRTDRRSQGPALGRGLAIAAVAAALLPSAALLWVVLSTAAPAPVVVTVNPAPPAASRPIDLGELKSAVDDLDGRLRAATVTHAALTARAEAAERGHRLQAIQRQVARARDARRAAGQAGPALRGPFPVNELGDLAAVGLGNDRWLIGRDGTILAPPGRQAPVPLGTTGRDEDAASFTATVDGVAVTLLRHCVPLEPYCLIDVVDGVDGVAAAAGADPRPPAMVDTGRLAQALAAVDATLQATAAVTATPPPEAAAAAAPTSSRPPAWLALLVAGVGLALGAGVARRLLGLSSAVKRSTWRLQAGLAGRAPVAGAGPATGFSPPPRSPVGADELSALEGAIDDVMGTLDGYSVQQLGRQHQRARLESAVAALAQARDRGGVARLSAEDDDDAITARLMLAVDQLLDALDERARRFTLGLNEVDGIGRLLSPLAQRLLRVARLPDLPQTAADELTSLGNALGQRARKAHALAALLEELSRLQPGGRDAITEAAALRTLPHIDAIRLAAADSADRDADEPI